MHAFARDLLLTKGTDLTDYEIGAAATKFGVDMIMADIKHDGTPHTTVGITVNVSCRAGKIRGYPHPTWRRTGQCPDRSRPLDGRPRGITSKGLTRSNPTLIAKFATAISNER